ncbi:hypothetical protein ENSA5_44640 [Enhygromyxa salina]|uniref:Uncharacterized protein n=1 Tax=Enhygromyxa salina TaxID=215803 RepID=A0A2S9XK36_9BACT|nr:hypothetical protein [Enhygromyxa salina]PRP93197.1 hypothetical protein ENSA5_44640 [Enhygromyxa salina]
MAPPTYAVVLAVTATTQACQPDSTDTPDECYTLDGNGDWPVSPTDFVQNYCGRGPTIVDEPGLGREVVNLCVAAPASGCDPCMWSAQDADTRLQTEISSVFAAAGCPSDYEPERFIRGCFAPNPGAAECCYTAEYVTDEGICDPTPDESP